MTYVTMLNGETPIFSQFGDDVYASDVVQQAIYTIVTELKKLNPTHVRRHGFDTIPVDDSIQRVLDNPNFLMTTSDYIEKIAWQLLLNYNAFIYKQYDHKGDLIALYPLRPTQVTFLENAQRLFVKMYFKDGSYNILPYDSLIHIKTHYSLSDLMGGDENGQPNNRPLLKTLRLNDILLEGVKKALNSSFAINGIVKYNTMLDDGSMQKQIEDFEKKLTSNTSGILGVDLKSEFVPVQRDLKVVDEPTLRFIDDKILRNFGTPLNIVRGEFTVEEYDAFYQKTIEPLVIAISQAHTKAIFTNRESNGYKNKIVFYPKELVFMSMSQKLQMVAELGQTGTLFENEKRVTFGYPPIPELVGVRLQSLNFVDVRYAQQYQVGEEGKPNEGGEDDET